MRHGLLLRLLGVSLPVVGLVIAVMWLALDTLAAGYFSVLMKQYHINPADSHHMFLSAVHRYLLWASLAALVLAAVLSLLLTRRVLGPLYEVIGSARLIARGEYGVRVSSRAGGEMGELAAAFNRMAESLDRMEKLRRNLVSDVAHELRTPLTNVRGYLEALVDGVVPPSADVFRLLQEETLRLVSLTEDLLRLARADASRTDLRLVPVDPGELLRLSIRSFELPFARKSIGLETTLDAPGARVRSEPGRFREIVENLLRNALQYTPEGGSVSIKLFETGDSIRVEVANTGPGILDEDLPYLFERFYRGEKSRSREFGGAGIGLAIVKELVQAHGGRVGVESSSNETLFWFTLPLMDIGPSRNL